MITFWAWWCVWWAPLLCCSIPLLLKQWVEVLQFQEHSSLVIIFLILMNGLIESALISQGDIWSWSLLVLNSHNLSDWVSIDITRRNFILTTTGAYCLLLVMISFIPMTSLIAISIDITRRNLINTKTILEKYFNSQLSYSLSLSECKHFL